MVMTSIITKIKESNKIAITAHVSPDGDAVGSVLALTLGLRSIEKEVYILSKEKASDNYSFLCNYEEINGQYAEVPYDIDCLIILDCGNFERINANINLHNKNYTLVNIDHHVSNDLYGDLNFVNENSGANGEIIYQLLKDMDINITPEIAQCLYTAIITDTGSFKYPSTTTVTHNIAGHLINTGINFNEIHKKIYENKKYSRVKLYGKVLDSLTLIHNNKICIMEITEEMLTELNINDLGDTADVVTFGMEIDEVEVAILLKEHKGTIKASLRSKSTVDVRKVAQIFGGGGHIRAAGLTLTCSLFEAKERIIEAIKKEMIN